MKDLNEDSFGLLIAFLLPGSTLLWGHSNSLIALCGAFAVYVWQKHGEKDPTVPWYVRRLPRQRTQFKTRTPEVTKLERDQRLCSLRVPHRRLVLGFLRYAEGDVRQDGDPPVIKE